MTAEEDHITYDDINLSSSEREFNRYMHAVAKSSHSNPLFSLKVDVDMGGKATMSLDTRGAGCETCYLGRDTWTEACDKPDHQPFGDPPRYI